MLVAFCGVWFVLGHLELHSKQYEQLTGGVLRPSATQPQSLQGREPEQLFALLSPTVEGVKLRFEQTAQTVVIEPEAIAQAYLNPWLSTTIQLSNADSYVFAQRRRNPKYQLVLFCSPSQPCITTEYRESGPQDDTFGWVLGSNSREAARFQLEIIRALIASAGGGSTLDTTQTLEKLIWEGEATR